MIGPNIPTSAITFIETQHGRLRREQRGISKKDLQGAKKYGTRRSTHPRPNGDLSAIYTYKDISYIVNEVTGEEITCYAIPITLDYVPIDDAMQAYHDKAVERIRNDLGCWTSNTVMVVDTSGSMKTADVWGTRTRLGAVWISIALDFLAHRIEQGNACATDVLSIVTLSQEPQIVIREEPCTWVLYNTLACIYNENLIPPRCHGPFLPSLGVAEKLLTRNPNASCAVALTFLSDGKPSDGVYAAGWGKEYWIDKIVVTIENIAKPLGRRLTFAAIGIGDMQEFDMLERMVEAAKDYLAVAMLQLPSMTSAAIGEVFTTIATSVSTTQSEMTDLTTQKQRKVRQVQRVSTKKVRERIDVVTQSDFDVYPKEKVVRTVYNEWYEGRRRKSTFKSAPLQHSEAVFVAMEKGPFGEGGERLAYRFYELAKDQRTIVGKQLVAKESRLIDAIDDEYARRKFVRTFCSTQQLARRLAQEFNTKLDATRRVHPKTPRVAFLDCSVYQLDDINLGKLSVLVEDRLDETLWQKWNSNNGYVEGMKQAPIFDETSLREGFKKLEIEDFGMIEEGDEEEEEDDKSEYNNYHFGNKYDQKIFTPSEVAQAFSHFTYWASGRKRLVCDLQGVYDEKANVLRFSDPVIHYHNPRKEYRRCVHGQTDRGKKGVAMFFETHKAVCGHLCKLMIRGFRTQEH